MKSQEHACARALGYTQDIVFSKTRFVESRAGSLYDFFDVYRGMPGLDGALLISLDAITQDLYNQSQEANE